MRHNRRRRPSFGGREERGTEDADEGGREARREVMRILFATCAPQQADDLVQSLLRERLIGCGNVVPGVRSHYWWQGELCHDEEAILVMETTRERCEAAIARLAELHAYDVPKIVTIDPEACEPRYLAWLRSVLAPGG